MKLINLFDFEKASEAVISRGLWDFIAGGADDEITLRRNRTAFEQISLSPRFLLDVNNLDTSTTVLGSKINLPLMISPTGALKHVHIDGDLAVARAAEQMDTVMIVATNANYTIEEISDATMSPLWFQLYHYDDDTTIDLVTRTTSAGYRAICVTVDSGPSLGKQRDIHNDFSLDPSIGMANINSRNHLESELFQNAKQFHPHGSLRSKNIFTWSKIEWLRSITSLPIILKGIMSPEDAIMAADHGIEGIIVSNHGGRPWDGLPSTIEILPRIADSVDDRMEIYLDSGIRRGLDIFKAVALGARAVMIGRPIFWGLSLNGRDGVCSILEILQTEFSRAMACCGVNSISEINNSHVLNPFDN